MRILRAKLKISNSLFGFKFKNKISKLDEFIKFFLFLTKKFFRRALINKFEYSYKTFFLFLYYLPTRYKKRMDVKIEFIGKQNYSLYCYSFKLPRHNEFERLNFNI